MADEKIMDKDEQARIRALEAQIDREAEQKREAEGQATAEAAKAKKSASASEPGGGLFDRVGGFFHRISAEAQRRRNAFENQSAESVADEKSRRFPRIRTAFSSAAHAVADPINHHVVKPVADHVVFPVTRYVGQTRAWKITAATGYVIGQIPHYVRYPLGRPDKKPTKWTKITVNGDFYTQAAASVIFGPVMRKLHIDDLFQEEVSADGKRREKILLVPKDRYPWLYRGLRLGRGVWHFGGHQLASGAYHYVATEKAPNGERYFSPLQVLNSAAFGVMAYYAWPFIAIGLGAAYYYGTWSTVNDVYIPNAGVYLNQNFVNPNGAGQIIAARDEIFTVLGKKIHPDGVVEELRFDLDYNGYFMFYEDSIRPDLAASKMNSQTQYGVKCDLEVTGIYARVPRFVRIGLFRWLDVRPEIVRVNDCVQLTEMPAAFKASAPVQLPPGAKPLNQIPAPRSGALIPASPASNYAQTIVRENKAATALFGAPVEKPVRALAMVNPAAIPYYKSAHVTLEKTPELTL